MHCTVVKKIRTARRHKKLQQKVSEIGLNPITYTFRYKALTSTKSRASRKGIEFNIKVTDLLWPSFCPVLGLELNYYKAGPVANRPSIDRIDPTKGYIKDNCRVISFRANLLKSNATIEELTLVLKDLTQLMK